MNVAIQIGAGQIAVLFLLAAVAFGMLFIQLNKIDNRLTKLIKGDKLVADTLQQLDASIAGLGTGITQLIADTQALIAAVQNLPGVDVTAEVDAINADVANLQALDTSVTGATPSSSSSSA